MEKYTVGKNGWLFLDNDVNKVFDQVTGNKQISDILLENIKHTLEERLAYAKKLEFKYVFFIIPEPHCVYSEFLPDGTVITDDRLATHLAHNFPDVVFYPLRALKLHKNDYLLYYKTDIHWTDVGAAIAYNEMSDVFGLDTKIDIDGSIDDEESVILGCLGEKANPPVYSKYRKLILNDNSEVVFDNNLVGTGKYLHLKSKNKNGKRCVIFGTSSTFNFIHTVSYYFSEVFCFWGICFDTNIINKLKPDIVISQMVERFVNGFFDRRSYFDVLTNRICSMETLEELNSVDFGDGVFSGLSQKILIQNKIYRHSVHGQKRNFRIEYCDEIQAYLEVVWKNKDNPNAVLLRGWSASDIDSLDKDYRIIYIQYEDDTCEMFSVTDLLRLDIAKWLQNEKHLFSGFSCNINGDKILSHAGNISIYIGYWILDVIYVKLLRNITRDEIYGNN